MSDRRRQLLQPTARLRCVKAFPLVFIGFFTYIGCASAEVEQDAWLVKGLVNETLELERTGAEVPWSNANTGNSGVIRVERTFYRADGTPCREYVRTTKQHDGTQSTTEGTGCRIGDGRWFLDEAPATQTLPSRSVEAGAATRVKEPKPSRRDTPPGSESAESGEKTVAAVQPSGKPSDEKSGDAPQASAEKWSPPPPPTKPQAPDFSLPSKSEI